MTGTLDRFVQHFGTDGPDLVVAVEAAAPARLRELAASVVAAPPVPAAAPADELRPVITARLGTFAAGRGAIEAPAALGVDVFAAADPRRRGSGRFADSVLRSLLYCHGLVLEDPLVLASDMYLSTSEELEPAARAFVATAAGSMNEVAPLLAARIVETFFPSAASAAWAEQAQGRLALDADADEAYDAFEALVVDGLHPKLGDFWRSLRAGVVDERLLEEAFGSEQPHAAAAFIAIVEQLTPQAMAENAAGVLAHALAGVVQLGGHHDLLLPTPLFERMLLAGAPGGLDGARLRRLVALEVPRLDDLQVEDIVAIRAQSDAFALWRTRLSAALDRARAANVNDDDSRRLVAESLLDARAALFDEVARSRRLSGLRRGVVSFAAGALGGAVGASEGGPSGVSLAAAGALASTIVSAAFSRNALPGFLRRHYVVFDAKERRV